MKGRIFPGRAATRLILRGIDYPIAGLFGFIILERCNAGGTEQVYLWLPGHIPLFAAGVLALICFYGLFRAFFARPVLPFAIYGALVFFTGTVNFYKLYYRSEPLIPYDIFNMAPAFTIAGKIGLFVDPGLVLNFLFYLLCLFVLYRLSKNRPRLTPGRRIAKGACVFCVSALCLFYLTGVPRMEAIGALDIRYDQYQNYRYNGFVVATLMNLSDNRVITPQNYGSAAVEELRAGILEAGAPASLGNPPQKPHIIALQMEAFGNPSLIDPGIHYTEDPFGPLDRFEGEIQRFHTLSSVYGGGTANTEYEFLTGNNMYFCPPGVIPFIHYMNNPKSSLVTDLESLGYRTVAIHPHSGSFYNRANAFPRLGFQRFVTWEEFDDPLYIGYYISDESFGKKVVEIFEEEKGRGPLFLFGISIQNHGPYNNPDTHRPYPVVSDERLELNETQYMELETYGANIHDSSVMLANLIQYFSTIDEPVLLLVFGDHQAAWSWAFRMPLGPEFDRRRYSTESFYWANYPLEDDDRPLISASGLGPQMMRKAGLPLSLYQRGIDLQFRDLLAYNIAIEVENDGEVYYAEEDRLEAFRLIQYDRMFGKNYLGQP